ncbi:MAG: GspE/PulE family protein [Verrucomicrobiales bacterium]
MKEPMTVLSTSPENRLFSESFDIEAPAPHRHGATAHKNGTSDAERIAAAVGLLPTRLARPACTIPAETLVRHLGRLPRSPDPWVPLATLGPLVIMGHHSVESEDFWGVPPFLVVRTIITPEEYNEVAKDLAARLGIQPMSASNALEGKMPKPPSDQLSDVLHWFVEYYPFASEDEAERMRRLFVENQGKVLSKPQDLAFLPRHFGVALYHIATGAPVFNPEQAPAQNLFPPELLDKHTVYPLFIGENAVYLLAANTSVYAFEDEWLSSGHEPLTLHPVIADPAAIRATIARDRARSARPGTSAQVGDLYYSDQVENLIEIDPVDIGRVNPQNPNNSPDQVVQWVLWRAISMRASDLHVEKFYNTARFRARVDGELVCVHSCSEEYLGRYIAMFKNYCGMGQQRQDTQDARFSIRLGQKRLDVRVAAIPCRREQQKIVMRFLDKQDGIKKLSELNLSPRQLSIIRDVTHRDQGLALVTGPTGSGKTTSLYAFINSINTDNINIQTIEDPIEYEIEGINQTQTDPYHGITFAAGLRSLLRCDPDVILVGESRDPETAQASVNAALTGHLVFTTLHANDSLRAISRLLSMGVESYLLADALALSQAQRLVRRLCGYCKTPTSLTDEMIEFLGLNGVLKDGKKPDLPIYSKGGCPECNSTGYSGRVALMEMCPVTPELQSLVAEGAPMSQMRQCALRDGFMSLYQEGLMHVLAGNTTFDEIACLSYTAPVMLERPKFA